MKNSIQRKTSSSQSKINDKVLYQTSQTQQIQEENEDLKMQQLLNQYERRKKQKQAKLNQIQSTILTDGNRNRDKKRFLKNVYMTVLFQIIYVIVFSLIVNLNDYLSKLFYRNEKLFIGAWCGTLCCIMLLGFRTKIVKRFPFNYLMLFIFVTFNSIPVAMISQVIKTRKMVLAAIFTLIIVTSLTGQILIQEGIINNKKSMVYNLLLTTLLLVTVFYVVLQDKQVFIYGINDIIFGMLLIFDTSMMMEGERAKIGKNDYIVASMFLFFDIMMIFYYILDALANNN